LISLSGNSLPKGAAPVRLAALYRGDAGDARLHVAVDGGFAAVDELAAGARRPDLAGLRDVGDLYARGADAVEQLRELAATATATVAPESVRYAPPVLRPGKIICVGLNYADHIAESRTAKPDRIVLFAKFPSCLVGHADPIRYPAITAELDYEGELAVVIGRQARNVPADSALDYVGGYTVINDVSARDLQGTEPQWIRGKALDTFAPLGPVLLDAAAAPPVAEMRLRTLVNGEVRQDASCAQMITGVPELIAYISNGITLEPGDIIATGTPSGVAMGMNPPKYLQPGDKVSIEITAIGELANTVAAAAALADVARLVIRMRIPPGGADPGQPGRYLPGERRGRLDAAGPDVQRAVAETGSEPGMVEVPVIEHGRLERHAQELG
jgi:2-keto-4-pentenoate hydratase/2-oxohepta-3-ene-1,7-dioic acid hydratase in catechol pathway